MSVLFIPVPPLVVVMLLKATGTSIMTVESTFFSSHIPFIILNGNPPLIPHQSTCLLILHQSTCLSVEPGTRFPVDQGGCQLNAGVWIFVQNWVRRMAVDAVFGGSVGRRDIASLGISQVNGDETYCGLHQGQRTPE